MIDCDLIFLKKLKSIFEFDLIAGLDADGGSDDEEDGVGEGAGKRPSRLTKASLSTRTVGRTLRKAVSLSGDEDEVGVLKERSKQTLTLCSLCFSKRNCVGRSQRQSD